MTYFIECLLEEVKDIQKILDEPMPMQITPEQERDYVAAEECYICEMPLGPDRVRDHCHLTGQYRGAAHNRCNLQLQSRRGVGGNALQIPVIFHNLRGYDANHIMKVIGNYANDCKVSCIANNMEKYITFSLGNLKFIDSLNFMNASLDTLVQNLEKKNDGGENFTHLNQHFTKEEELILLKRKGVFPYTYLEGPHVFEEKHLPPQEAFFNDLQQKSISEEDYRHAQKVWKTFNMRDLGEYHDLYMKTDVLLLADVYLKISDVSVFKHID